MVHALKQTEAIDTCCGFPLLLNVGPCVRLYDMVQWRMDHVSKYQPCPILTTEVILLSIMKVDNRLECT